MVRPGLINLDFADVETVMSSMGKAMMGTGEAEGEKRAEEATNAALNNPLIDEYSLKGAKGLLVNITGGSDLTLFEVDEAVNKIRAEVDPEAELIFGSIEDENLNGKIRVSIVATSLDGQEPQIKPVINMVHRLHNRNTGYDKNLASTLSTNQATLNATEGATALNINQATNQEQVIQKNLEQEKIKETMDIGAGDTAFFVCDQLHLAAAFAGNVRTKLGAELDLLEKDVFRMCWTVDFPMYERDPESGEIKFSHNPFSMPQGGKDALDTEDPLDLLAYQYDIVCNGVELSSGAIRNHQADTMIKAFQIAGYSEQDVIEKFGGMLRAFQFGAPPHGGLAPGIDRIVMLIANEPNIREVTLFPMNQQAQDLLMSAPSEVNPSQVKELFLHVQIPPKDPKG